MPIQSLCRELAEPANDRHLRRIGCFGQSPVTLSLHKELNDQQTNLRRRLTKPTNNRHLWRISHGESNLQTRSGSRTTVVSMPLRKPRISFAVR
jgi:hypothetical protein